MGDLNGLIDDGKRGGITRAFEVVGKYENGRKVIDFSGEVYVMVILSSNLRVFISIQEMIH